MFLLVFFVLLIQFITYWIFDPITSLLMNILEVRYFPIVALIVFIFLFSGKHPNNIKN